MNNFPSLQECLKEWREASEQEAVGIQAGQWDKVARCQQCKTSLQEIITSLRGNNGASALAPEDEAALRELIDMEQRNLRLLSQRRERLRGEQARVQTAGGNLRRVRSAYGTQPSMAAWNSYS
jgi:hypothetical protein